MVNDPYQVLGVSRNASNDEIKRAYRELIRKYHPDSYADNPLADLAEEKFKEIQEAYDAIMKEREGGGTYSYGYQGGSSGSSGEEPVEMTAVYNYLNSRHYQEALGLLSRMPNHTARWYYCSAIANGGLGNNMTALEYARQAVNMEPGNMEYQNLLNQLQWSGQRYQANSGGYTNNPLSTGNCCCDLWIADTLCECMGGDLCSCM